MKTVAVYAGNEQQYLHYLEEEILPKAKTIINYSSRAPIVDGVQYIFLRDPHRLRGLRDFQIVRYGTWHDRDDVWLVQDLESHAKKAGDIK